MSIACSVFTAKFHMSIFIFKIVLDFFVFVLPKFLIEKGFMTIVTFKKVNASFFHKIFTVNPIRLNQGKPFCIAIDCDLGLIEFS